jgi:hypothetical protein
MDKSSAAIAEIEGVVHDSQTNRKNSGFKFGTKRSRCVGNVMPATNPVHRAKRPG